MIRNGTIDAHGFIWWYPPPEPEMSDLEIIVQGVPLVMFFASAIFLLYAITTAAWTMGLAGVWAMWETRGERLHAV